MVKVSCSTLSFDGFGDTDFTKTFLFAKEVGYRFVEFNCWHPATLTPVKIRDIKKRCQDSGLEAVSLHISSIGGANSHHLAKDVCHKLRAIDSARELGAGRIVFSGSHPRGSEGGIEAVITVLRNVIPYAEEENIDICLENHESNTVENLDDYERIFNELDSSHLGMCMDTGHFEAAGVRLDEVVERFSTRISHIHLKENGRFGVKDFCYFGEGTTDNIRIVEMMIGLGYSGYLDIEVSPEIGDFSFDPDHLTRPLYMFGKYETAKG